VISNRHTVENLNTNKFFTQNCVTVNTDSMYDSVICTGKYHCLSKNSSIL